MVVDCVVLLLVVFSTNYIGYALTIVYHFDKFVYKVAIPPLCTHDTQCNVALYFAGNVVNFVSRLGDMWQESMFNLALFFGAFGSSKPLQQISNKFSISLFEALHVYVTIITFFENCLN